MLSVFGRLEYLASSLLQHSWLGRSPFLPSCGAPSTDLNPWSEGLHLFRKHAIDWGHKESTVLGRHFHSLWFFAYCSDRLLLS